jgi:DNA-binding NarL/FixJ family response regulator
MSPPPRPAVTSVWLLEDHPTFAKQIRRLLAGEEDLDCPYHFSHPDELFDKLKFTQERPDLLLLDLGLPGRDGLQVLVELRQLLPSLKILVLSAFDDRERVYRAVCNGASGYLLKTTPADEILQGVRDVLHGTSALSPAIAKMILEGFAKHGPVQEVEPLTQREEEVLRLLVRGCIKKEIADQLAISQHTVDMHLRAVYRKLHVRTQTEAVSKALRQGLV